MGEVHNLNLAYIRGELVLVYETSGWSEQIILTKEEKFLRNYSAVFGKNGHLYAALNLAEVYDKVTNGSIYGKAELVVKDLSANTDLAIGTYLSYDNAAVAPGAKLPLTFAVTNQGMQKVSSFDVIISDHTGKVLKSETITCNLEAGETREFSCTCQLPKMLSYQEMHLRIEAEGEWNVSDNSVRR